MQDINVDQNSEVLYATYYAPAEAPLLDLPVVPSGSAVLTINGTVTGPSVTFGGGTSGFSYTAVGTTTLNLVSALTTKGDIYTWSTVGTRLGVGANGTVLTADSGETTGLKWAAPATISGANPTASVGLTAVNGAATTFLRSDGAPALDQSIVPTWTGLHTFTNASGIAVSKNQNGITTATITNTTAGASAQSRLQMSSDTYALYVGQYSSSTSAYGALVANGSYLYSSSTQLTFMVDNASGVIAFATGGNAEKVRFDAAGNIGIGTSTFGTSAAKVLALFNGTVPSTSPADTVQLFSTDISAGNASLGMRTETAVTAAAAGASDAYLNVTINGTVYKLLLHT